MNIAEWLHATANTAPDAPALMEGPRVEADYAGFARRAAGLAASLRDRLGAAPGDRIGIFMKNRTEYLEALYGILWAGAVIVPVNAKLHPKEAAWILNDAGAKLAFISDDVGRPLAAPECGLADDVRLLSVDGPGYRDLRAGTAAAHPEPREDADLSWLFYTSGTTGKPKGVMLSNANLLAMSLCYPIDVDAVAPEDAALYAAPMSHGAGMYNFVHVRRGARHAIPPSAGFDSGEILDLAKELKNVSMFAAPTMVRRLVDTARSRGENGAGIKTIVYGGGPMYLADIEEAVAVMGPRLVQIYGQGESPMTITALSRDFVADRRHPGWRARLGSVGRAQSTVELRIGAPEGEAPPPGEVGEVMVRGPQVMLGYWRNPEATGETLKNGWLRTGDMGWMDADGFLTLTDRSKDVIISGGTNIYPREVEEALLTHADVHEVSVTGRAHADWGEEVVAFVVLKPGADWDPAALDRHCTERIARFKRPKAYYRLAELPKNNYGKIVKTELREMLTNMEETR